MVEIISFTGSSTEPEVQESFALALVTLHNEVDETAIPVEAWNLYVSPDWM